MKKTVKLIPLFESFLKNCDSGKRRKKMANEWLKDILCNNSSKKSGLKAKHKKRIDSNNHCDFQKKSSPFF